ncbi:capsular polysaccharide biosynthesis protein [Paenibacillus sp. V4I3]|uniref:YveK family protein n=1 Tax=unclassified Paenibacillus TaxID=185978 RepID=UPI00277F8389|nr:MULTISPECIES: Wzz/FepE/Etk N-terminal domain-containing protein [unclassified Paenibacillus]MDQ0873207.1 capsular polysaccharide biosynthesis protein [Paenibacillus sp. V4I3]MDQ0890876.1 capsular polysaccharide biosynthesis protein [Paenibacillus sp. V4I9]
MKLHDYFAIIRSNLWMVVIIVAVSCTATTVYGHFKFQPDYEAHVMLMLRNNASDQQKQLTWDAISTNNKLITTYKEILTSPPILNEVVQRNPQWELTAAQVSKKLKVKSANQMQFISLSVKDKSYNRAASIANAVADVFQKNIVSIMKVDNVTFVYKANAQEQAKPITLPLALQVLLSFVISFLTGVTLIFGCHYFYGRMKKDQIERLLGVPLLAVTDTIRSKDYRQ